MKKKTFLKLKQQIYQRDKISLKLFFFDVILFPFFSVRQQQHFCTLVFLSVLPLERADVT
jgi:hypothetical protein